MEAAFFTLWEEHTGQVDSLARRTILLARRMEGEASQQGKTLAMVEVHACRDPLVLVEVLVGPDQVSEDPDPAPALVL